MSRIESRADDHDGASHPLRHPHHEKRLLGAVTAIGIVYGDIGTSPLYALQVALGATGDPIPSEHDVIGITSLILWTILLVVAVKYVGIVMRADNEGEGGILALLSLVGNTKRPSRHRLSPLVVLGVLGAAFIYGDGVITPAMSVLSALEGINVAAPGFESWIIPLTLIVLVLLFAIQSRGTSSIGSYFGPIMVLWFFTIAALGLHAIFAQSRILEALDPEYALGYLRHGGRADFFVVGAAFLSVTGAEALYADMGHVGARAIRRAWFGLVLPALVLSYLGQGALVLANPIAAANPFYNLAPKVLTWPLLALATAATIIASQALISGAFSLTRQAMQMRLLPRIQIRSTSGEHQGQIYMGVVNWALMAGTIVVVLSFRSSSHLAAAYGIAVSGTMLVTTILLFDVVRNRWRWPTLSAVVLIGVFAVIDATFLAANATKIAEGGWFPLAVGGVLAYLMLVWRSGTLEVQRRLEDMSVPFADFLAELDSKLTARIPGTSVVLTRALDLTSPILIQQVRHNRVLHEHVILITIQLVGRPTVPARERLEIVDLGQGFHRVIAKIGFMQTPDLPAIIRGCARAGLEFCNREIHYYVAYEHVERRPHRSHFPLLIWHTFSTMSKFGARITDFLRVPDKQVFEIGIKVQI